MKHLTKPHTLSEIGIPTPTDTGQNKQADGRKIDGAGLLFGCAAGVGAGFGG